MREIAICFFGGIAVLLLTWACVNVSFWLCEKIFNRKNKG